MTSRISFAATLRRAIGPLVIFETAIDLATIFFLDPLLLLLVGRVVSLSDDPFVGNAALVSFARSPVGMASFATAAIGLIFVNVLVLAGISLVLWNARLHVPVGQAAIWRTLALRLPSLLAISALAFVAALLLAIPVLATAVAARHWWLSKGDLYFYISTRPPEFLWVLGAVGSVAAVCALAGLYLLLRTGLALPICLLRSCSAAHALRLAMQATRQRARTLMPRLVAVAVALMLVWAIAAASLSRLLGWLLTNPLTDTTLHWVSLAFAGFVAVTFAVMAGLSRASLMLVLITDSAAADALPERPHDPLPHRFARLRLAAALLVCVAVPVAALIEVARASNMFSNERTIAITAHRAGSARAPENTLAALKTAIADGADMVEIDVQETADGHVVLLHDTDLRRVAGLPRSVWDMRLDELQALDVGSWFSPAFHAERIPTLGQFAIAARGRVGMNIELKNNRQGEDLAPRTVEVLRETGTADQAVISSLDLGLLREVRQIAPQVRLGLILAAGIGNMHRVDVDFFALSRRLATPAVIRQLHASGREVHVWTLDDQVSIARAMLNGADNIITSDTLLAVRVRRWFQGLSEPERTLLQIDLSLAGFARPRGPARVELEPTD